MSTTPTSSGLKSPAPALPFSFLVHALGVAGTTMVLIWCINFRGGLAWESPNKNLIFNLHPVLILIGLIVIGGEAIISFNKSLPFIIKRDHRKLIHLILHGIALILGIIGVYMAFKFHNESGIPNLYSLHSWLGIGIISLYGIQWVYGLIVFFFHGGSVKVRRESVPWHVLIGLFVYVLAVGNSAIGFLEKLTFLEINGGLDKFGSEALLVNFTAIVTVLFGTFVVLTLLSQLPHPISNSPADDAGV